MQKPKKKKSKDDEEGGEAKKGKKRGHQMMTLLLKGLRIGSQETQVMILPSMTAVTIDDDDDHDDSEKDDGEEVEDEEMESETTRQGVDLIVTAMEPQRMAQFRSLVQKAFKEEYSQSLPLDNIVRRVNEGQSQSFSRAEIDKGQQNLSAYVFPQSLTYYLPDFMCYVWLHLLMHSFRLCTLNFTFKFMSSLSRLCLVSLA